MVLSYDHIRVVWRRYSITLTLVMICQVFVHETKKLRTTWRITTIGGAITYHPRQNKVGRYPHRRDPWTALGDFVFRIGTNYCYYYYSLS